MAYGSPRPGHGIAFTGRFCRIACTCDPVCFSGCLSPLVALDTDFFCHGLVSLAMVFNHGRRYQPMSQFSVNVLR